jgi:hypothetical protein
MVALPVVARAQQPLDPVKVTARVTRAQRLETRAASYEMASDMRRWGKAAALYERAAGLRAPEDPGGYTNLRRAAFLRHGIGQADVAGALMERAADQAMARGDVFNAAYAYVDAAYIAAERRDPPLARELVGKGTLLLHSPLLEARERAALRARVAQAGERLGVEVAALTQP